MTDKELKNLVKKIQSFQAEFQTIEVKRAEDGVPEKLFDTLSSFSNQNDGGVIVFGLYEKNGFEITGIADVQMLQKKVMEQCEQMEPRVRAVFSAVEIDGKNVVSAEIPPVDIADRPCFNRAKGRKKSSYVRVGDADIPMSEYEVYSFEAYRKKYQDDVRTVDRAEFSSLNTNTLNSYLLKLKENKPNLAALDDKQITELMSIIKDGKPTLSAELLFGLYPQAFFPQLGIIATAVQGTEMGDVAEDGSRFADSKRIEGTISEMISGAMSFVKANTRVRTIIGKDGTRTDYPLGAVREVLLNALVHRDYSIHTEGMPVQLIIFSDRMEIINPGGLYGRLTIDMLGKAQPDTRNPVLATALEVMGVTENRYSGIPTIRKEMSEGKHPAPEFSAIHGEFKVCLRNSVIETASHTDKQTALLEFLRTPRSKKEIADYLGINSVTYAVKTYILPLVEEGIVEMTIPEAPGSRRQKYAVKK